MTQLPSSLYEPRAAHDDPAGGWFESSELTRGPWNPGHQHAGPPAALLARALEHASQLEDGQTVRLSYDILRPVPLAALRVETRVLRPGRRVEQIEATLRDQAGQELMRCTAWRVRSDQIVLPAGLSSTEPPLPGPDQGHAGDFGFWKDDVAYYRALDWRFVRGGFDAPGDALVWTRLLVPLVAGEQPSPLERLLVMADAASGVSAVLDWERYLFINVDLGIHLERPPAGEWFAMDATTRIGPEGAGLCTSTLFDAEGRLGVSTQSLLVAAR